MVVCCVKTSGALSSWEPPGLCVQLYHPSGTFWQVFFWILYLPNEHYWNAHIFFTSGTSKGTSWLLFLSMSASIRRVLSLGMMFSSCIFVHVASAFCQSFVSSEKRQGNTARCVLMSCLNNAMTHRHMSSYHQSILVGGRHSRLHHRVISDKATPCWERAIKALIWSTECSLNYAVI